MKRKPTAGVAMPATLNELAAAEKINSSYVSRLFRLTLLAPDIVEAILDGRQPPGMTLPALMEPFPVEWQMQRPPAFATVRVSSVSPDPAATPDGAAESKRSGIESAR